ncbi:hypothetical protein MC885_019379 [Smutsia gigantea]|nr:hypothetical protein MC885_019379 [Smutsia gigantea]
MGLRHWLRTACGCCPCKCLEEPAAPEKEPLVSIQNFKTKQIDGLSGPEHRIRDPGSADPLRSFLTSDSQTSPLIPGFGGMHVHFSGAEISSPVLTPKPSDSNPYPSFGATLARDDEKNLWSAPHDVSHTEADDDRILYNLIVIRNQQAKDSEVSSF